MADNTEAIYVINFIYLPVSYLYIIILYVHTFDVKVIQGSIYQCHSRKIIESFLNIQINSFKHGGKPNLVNSY